MVFDQFWNQYHEWSFSRLCLQALDQLQPGRNEITMICIQPHELGRRQSRRLGRLDHIYLPALPERLCGILILSILQIMQMDDQNIRG